MSSPVQTEAQDLPEPDLDGAAFTGMDKPENIAATNAPLEVEAGDREVVIGIPDDGRIVVTSHAAEVSALRLLDAAQKSRTRG